MAEPPAVVELDLSVSLCVETVVGQACESLIAHFCPVLSYVVQPFRALSWRGGAARALNEKQLFLIF